jgi:glycosyltransferase involved in cell wall biosynthesis
MRVAILMNQVFPYRTPVFDLLGPHYTVIYSCQKEGNRDWELPELKHDYIFLKPRMIPYGVEGFAHLNFDIFKALREVDPDVVVLYGFGTTQQLAYLWARLHKRKIVTWSDCWSHTERNRSKRQIRIQRMFIRHSAACIASSLKGRDYFHSLGAQEVFIAPMAIDNERFASQNKKRPFDLLVNSQLIERKGVLFLPHLMKELPDKSLLLIGDGPLKKELLVELRRINANFHHIPFVPWEEIHWYYQRSKIFLFPTQDDSWGIVANEALAAGCPVITTDKAGCAGELVRHKESGVVLQYTFPDVWANWVKVILSDWKSWSEDAKEAVSPYIFASQAQAIRDAVAEGGKGILYRETRTSFEGD